MGYTKTKKPMKKIGLMAVLGDPFVYSFLSVEIRRVLGVRNGYMYRLSV